jgi:hypothetical protein
VLGPDRKPPVCPGGRARPAIAIARRSLARRLAGSLAVVAYRFVRCGRPDPKVTLLGQRCAWTGPRTSSSAKPASIGPGPSGSSGSWRSRATRSWCRYRTSPPVRTGRLRCSGPPPLPSGWWRCCRLLPQSGYRGRMAGLLRLRTPRGERGCCPCESARWSRPGCSRPVSMWTWLAGTPTAPERFCSVLSVGCAQADLKEVRPFR